DHEDQCAVQEPPGHRCPRERDTALGAARAFTTPAHSKLSRLLIGETVPATGASRSATCSCGSDGRAAFRPSAEPRGCDSPDAARDRRGGDGAMTREERQEGNVAS